MLGDVLLISPVLEEGKREVETYFPPGIWFRLDDFNGSYNGNRIISAGEDEPIPTFIKGFIQFKFIKLFYYFFLIYYIILLIFFLIY